MFELLFTMALPTNKIILTDSSYPLLFLYDSLSADEKCRIICIYSLMFINFVQNSAEGLFLIQLILLIRLFLVELFKLDFYRIFFTWRWANNGEWEQTSAYNKSYTYSLQVFKNLDCFLRFPYFWILWTSLSIFISADWIIIIDVKWQ
jgi:hypothetical protein